MKGQSRWIRVCWLASGNDCVEGRSLIVDFPLPLSTVSFPSSSPPFCELSIGVIETTGVCLSPLIISF